MLAWLPLWSLQAGLPVDFFFFLTFRRLYDLLPIFFSHIKIKRFSEKSSSYVLGGQSKRATERACERDGGRDGRMEGG